MTAEHEQVPEEAVAAQRQRKVPAPPPRWPLRLPKLPALAVRCERSEKSRLVRKSRQQNNRNGYIIMLFIRGYPTHIWWSNLSSMPQKPSSAATK